MYASQPIPADGGGIERVPPPPIVAAPRPESTRPAPTVDPILLPPALFTDAPPPPAESIRATTVTGVVHSWQLVIEGGRTFQLLGSRVLLGRDPVAKSGEQEIVVVDPTRTVSKTHALLELVDDVWRVTDLGSVNGVRLIERNGSERALVPGIPEPVSGRFSLGTVLIELRN